MLYRPSALVSPENRTLVSTLVASIFTPTITAPLGSVTRPASVAVGPARRELATRQAANIIKRSKPGRAGIMGFVLQNCFLSITAEYAARVVVLYQRTLRLRAE